MKKWFVLVLLLAVALAAIAIPGVAFADEGNTTAVVTATADSGGNGIVAIIIEAVLLAGTVIGIAALYVKNARAKKIMTQIAAGSKTAAVDLAMLQVLGKELELKIKGYMKDGKLDANEVAELNTWIKEKAPGLADTFKAQLAALKSAGVDVS